MVQSLFTPTVMSGLVELPSRLASAIRLIPSRLRTPAFWQVQGMVGAVTLLHYAMEVTIQDPPYDHLHHIAPILYIFPIIYGSLHFRLEGGLLTGLWCSLLSVPNIVLWHRESMQWLLEVAQLSTGVIVGLVLSRLVEQEAAERRQAQAMSSRLALLHQQVTHAQEEERSRVARELHDETAQSLVLLCRTLDRVSVTPRLPEAARRALQEARATAEEALGGVRRFSRDLRPSILDDLGLVAAIEGLTSELTKRQSIDARLEVTGPQRRLPAEVELSLFRIAQEALRNVEKHSGASQVTVSLDFGDGGLRLIVRDNGKGFEPLPSLSDLVTSGKLGLVGIQERAQLLGAALQLQAEVGKGTCITLTLNC